MKSIFDYLLSSIAVVILFPIIIAIGFLVLIYLGRPILFIQSRPGLKGKPFDFYKFRTMAIIKDKNGNLLSDHLRVTKLGKFLRKTSLDELPSLINVIKGDMSLVGPRPLLTDYLELYDDEQMKRHNVKPGITGWAQINGRNQIEWQEKFNYDLWYVRNRTFWVDLKILFITLFKVLKRDGIYYNGDKTMPAFTAENLNKDKEF